jgi:hypothetical protein
MRIRGQVACVLLLALCSGSFVESQTKAFTIVAASVTMPATGDGSSAFTVSNIPMAGTLGVTCEYSGPATTARIPTCGGGAIFSKAVTAGQTIQGAMTLYPYGILVPAGKRPAVRRRPDARLFALALMAPLLGLGWRRGRRWLVLMAIGAVVLGGVSACGGNPNGMTPGTYSYLITADNESGAPTPLGAAVHATFTVKVP